MSSLPRKGLLAPQASGISNAIDMALEDSKKALAGWTLEHVQLDGGSEESGEWSRERERSNALSAVSDPAVIAYVGPYNSAASKVSLPITNQAGLLQLGPTVTWPGLTAGGWDIGEPLIYYPQGQRNFARLMPPDSRQGDAAAHWAAQLGAKTVYVLNDGSSYSLGLEGAFRKACLKQKVATVGESAKGADWQSTLAEEIKASGADAVFYAPSSVSEAVHVAPIVEGVSLRLGVFASDTALSDQFLEQKPRGKQVWHVVFNGHDLATGTAAAGKFRSDYTRRYGSAPTQFAANAYDLTMLAVEALRKEGRVDRQAITKRVIGTQHYAGVTGNVSFDERGDPVGWEMSGYTLGEGKFTLDRLLRSAP